MEDVKTVKENGDVYGVKDGEIVWGTWTLGDTQDGEVALERTGFGEWGLTQSVELSVEEQEESSFEDVERRVTDAMWFDSKEKMSKVLDKAEQKLDEVT